MELELEGDKHHFVKHLPQVNSVGCLQLNGGYSPLASGMELLFPAWRIRRYQAGLKVVRLMYPDILILGL